MTSNRRLFSSIRWFLFAAGILTLVVMVIPFEVQKSILDRIAPDGNLESFTYSVFSFLKAISFIIAFVSLSFYYLIGGYEERARLILHSIQVKIAHFRNTWILDLRKLISWLISDLISDNHRWALISFIILGLVLRFAFLGRPMGHDETYTYMAFASRGIKTAITDYHLPNNHVLHTILVVISTSLFGNSPEAIRLPAFIAGVLLIPAVYLVAVK